MRHPVLPPAALALLALALVVAPPVLAWAGQMVVVAQDHRRFAVETLSIARGDVVRFFNADEFLHQITVRALGFSTPDGEEPGEHVDVAFPASGTFEVRCEIHPKMLMTVTVR